MDSDVIISKRVRDLIVAILAAVFIVLFVHTLVTTRSFVHRRFPGFVVLNNNLVPTVGVPGWPGFAQGIKFGDVVLSADDRKFADGDDLYAYVGSRPLGAPVRYRLLRQGEEVIRTAPVSEFSGRDWLLLVPVMMLFGMILYGMGVVVFFLRPNSNAARAFLFNGVLVGITLTGVPAYTLTHHWSSLVCQLALPLIGPSFVLLGLHFPETQPGRRPYLVFIFGTALPLVACYVYFFNQVLIFIKFDLAMLILISINNGLSFFLLGRAFYGARDPVTRQKAKIVIFGFTLTFLAAWVFVIGTLILKIMPLFWFLPVGLIMFPLSIAYAILKHNLFDVDLFIRQSVSYILASAAALLMFIAFISLFSLALQGLVFARASQTAAVISTAIIVLGFRPVHQRVERFISLRFFREKYEYQTTIRRAAAVLSSIVELKPLLDQILFTVVDSIKIERGLILLKDQEAGHWKPVAANGYAPEAHLAPIPAEHPLIKRLEDGRRTIQLDELRELDPTPEREAVVGLMERLALALVAPVIYEWRLIGLMGLSSKRSGAGYSSEDEDLLQTLMIQTSVSIENARKVEELKKMVALETSYQELKRLDAMKDNLLHMVSHDLRTPMTGILGYAYLLHDGVGSLDPEVQREYLDVVIKEGERLTRLINDLLDLQRFEAGRMDLELADLDLIPLIQESARLFAITMENEKLAFAAELPPGPIIVTGHRDRLAQVIANLLSNAIKFSAPGGRIRITAERIGANGPERSGGLAEEEVKVSVQDAGRGIPREFQASVFDKFLQVRDQTSKKIQGTGLGLALVKEIIQYHRGRVGFESEPGRGSNFFFFLPVKGKGDDHEKDPDRR